MYLIPPVASILLLAFLWWTDALPRPRAVAGCVLAGVAALWFAPMYSVLWVAALVVNVGIAIYLVIRLKLSQ